MKVDGGFVRRRRLELGLGLSEVARSSRIDRGSLGRVESNKAGLHMASLRRLAAALDVPIIDLYAEKLDQLTASPGTAQPAA